MSPSLRHWLNLGIVIAAALYIGTKWEGHSEATRQLPARRTVYDFLQTHPRVVFAACVFGLAAIDLVRGQ